MNNIRLVICLLSTLSLFTFHTHAQDMNGVVFDPRDGKQYETVFVEFEIEGGITVVKEWFAENLNYHLDGAYCYNDYEEYCDTFGRLYSWKAALDACPEGWHIPIDMEWEALTKKHGGKQEAGATFKEGGDSGLNLLMAGFGESNGEYIDVGVNGYYWKKSTMGARSPGLITIHNGVDYFTDDEINESHRNSIRCVRDDDNE